MPQAPQRTRARPRQVHRLPLTEARVHLGAVVKRARLHKDYFILEKDGLPVAGLMDIDEFEDYLELQDRRLRTQIRESAREYRAGRGRPAGDLLARLQAGSPRKRGARRPA
jgi:hypothetical protein